MSIRTSNLQCLCLVLLSALFLLKSSEAFAPIPPSVVQQRVAPSTFGATTTTMTTSQMTLSSSIELSALTLDPTTIVSDILGGLLGTPAILLVPILAALGVASLIAYLIVSYANPEVENDD